MTNILKNYLSRQGYSRWSGLLGPVKIWGIPKVLLTRSTHELVFGIGSANKSAGKLSDADSLNELCTFKILNFALICLTFFFMVPVTNGVSLSSILFSALLPCYL